jgi:hypothetical protein
MALRSQEAAEAVDPVVRGGVARCTQKMSSKMALFVMRIVSTSAISSTLRRPRLCGMST